MISEEDFTFPVITSNNAAAAVNLALLPPLWRISDDADSNQTGRQRRPSASPVIQIDSDGSEAEAEAELQEKMDLLWEDFNEESSDSGFSEETSEYHNNNCGRDELEALGLQEFRNVQQLNLMRAKPKKMKSVVKVMKKLFSLQNTRTNHKRSTSTPN